MESFGADKSIKKIRQDLSSFSDSKSKADIGAESGLSVAEIEDLNEGLSGEKISAGFTDKEEKELAKGLAGKSDTQDLIKYTKSEGGSKKEVSFYGEKREVYLDMSPDTLRYYKNKYPNIAKAYLSNGIVTLLDKNNVSILDENGNPVTVDFNKVKDSPSLNLVSFYINHAGENLDVNKMFELLAIQEQINSTPVTDENYKTLQSEIEQQKLEIMNYNERKNYITAKIWNALSAGDKSALINTLGEFYDYECRMIDKKLGITGTKEYIKEKTHLNDLVEFIDKVVDNKTDKLTTTELVWEIVKGIGDAIDAFIWTQGATMMGALGAGTKAVTAIPKIGPVLGGAIQAYFGTEGTVLIGSGFIDGAQAITKEEARTAGAELGLGGIMAKGGLESFKAGFKGLKIKEFRSKIDEGYTMEELDVIRKIIEESDFSKPEKQMLQNECAKQQGKIQNTQITSNTAVKNARTSSFTEKFEQQKKRSQIAYKIFKECKTPAQREIAKILLNDSRFYNAKINEDIFIQIIKNCKTTADIDALKAFIDKLTQNPALTDKNGTYSEYLLYCLRNAYKPEEINIKLKLLEEYQNSKTNINSNNFAYLLYKTELENIADSLKILFNNKKAAEVINNADKNLLDNILLICDRCVNGYMSDIPLEQIVTNYNLRTILSANLESNYKNIRYLIDKILSDKTLQTQEEPYMISDGQTEFDYSMTVKKLLELLCENNNYYKNEAMIKFFADILCDENLGKNVFALKSLENTFYTDNGTLYRIFHNTLKNGTNSLTEGELLSFMYEYQTTDMLETMLSKFVQNGFKTEKPSCVQEEIMNRALIESSDILKEFTNGRSYTDDDLYMVFVSSCYKFGKEILSDICRQKEYTAEDITNIVIYTKKSTADITKRILNTSYLSAKEKVGLIKSVYGADQQCKNLVNLLLDKNMLDYKVILKVIEAVKIMDANDAGGNNGKIDPKKVDKYLRLLQNPKTSKWTVKMLNEGWDIETISRLSVTKRNFFTENNNDVAVDQNTKFFMDFGLNEKEANAIVKAITKSGTINVEMQQTAIDLINAGIPKHKIGQIMSSATISGDYNARVPADAMALNGMGLNGFVERYLPALNNLSAVDIAVKFNQKTKAQLKTMIKNIPEDTKPALRAKGFDLEGILEKLNAKGIVQKTSAGKPQKVLDGLRNRSDITGFERLLIEKFNPVESVWRSSEATKTWAEEKYTAYKEKNYISTRDTEQTRAEDITQKRAEGLKSWFDYMDTEEELKNNPFARVLISEFITKDLLPENSSLPPVLDKALVKQVLSDALKDGSSFKKGYRAELNTAAKQSSDAMDVEIGGRKMTWYTIPQTDSSHPDFQTNVAKVRAFSDGTNWCIRTWNAEPYLQQGNLHFLVDETGMAQVCIREGERSGFREDRLNGEIAEIQKRQQNASVPVAYVDFIQDFVGKKKLKGYEDNIEKAAKQKPEFNQTKTRLQKLSENKDYKAILELMGINVKILPDGSWEISHYTSYFNEIALNDYGINENNLLANVSRIKGDADFKDSNATSLPNLQEVGGSANFGYSEISNLKGLKKIKGKKINW